jgi:hypothetical protein
MAGLFLAAAAAPIAAPARAAIALRPGAGWRHSAACAPFDYIPEADRRSGGLSRGQRIVRVQSHNNRYLYQRVNTGGYVRLYRQLSGGSAREGRDWGYDRRGIWVNNGLSAEFLVGRPGPISSPAVPDSRRPPAWAIGTFRGRDSERKATITLTIRADGSVRHRTDYDSDKRTVNQSGSYRDGRLVFDSARLDLDRAGGGIRTTETGGRRGRITYQRIN